MNKKKIIALALSCSLAFSSVPAVFADTAIPADSLAAKNLGMLVGKDASGVTSTYVSENPTRIQAAIMFLRLKGLLETATSFTGTANFADAKDMQWAEGKNIMAYLKANPDLGFVGTGNNTFNANEKIDAASYYKVMLEALGYKANVDFTWEQVKTFAASKGLSKVANDTNFQIADVATATIEALKAEIKGGSKTLIAQLVETGVVTAAKAQEAGLIANTAVASIVAKTASSFAVKFNSAVADTSKVAFETKRGSATVALTTTWNEAKTEATLTYAGIIPEGDFVITVKADGTALDTKTIAITKQKVAKIEVEGTQLSVAPTTVDGLGNTVPGKGYASYKVYDQYGVDITNTNLANSGITFNASVGTIDTAATKNGLVVVSAFNNTVLSQYPTAVITAVCTDSAVSATKSLTVSLAQGTLSDITLNKVTNVDNKDVVANDTISKFYIDFTAKDINGNVTKSAAFINNGLILNGGELMSSNPTILGAKVVADPTDSNKSVIELVVKNGTVYADTPVVITAMTKTGKTSTITVNVKKPATLDKLTIMTPSVLVAAGDQNVVIPYEAFDQNGNALTKYDDIVGNFQNTTSNLTFVKNADGTLKITTGTTNFVKGVPTIFQVVTTAGKSSMITIKADEAVTANDLTIDASVVKQFMQIGATQGMDFGAKIGGFKVTDQYGRVMDLTSATDDTYYVTASVPSGSTVLSVNANNKAYMGNKIVVTADGKGTENVTFDLMKKGETTPIATKTVAFTVVDNKDITGITIADIPTMYAVAQNSSDTEQVKDWNRTITVNGKLANGGIVKLNTTANPVQFFVDNSNFEISGTAVRAMKLATGVTEATGKVTATTVINNSMLTVSTNVKSTSAAPVAASVDVSVKVATNDITSGSALTGFTVSGDTVTGKVAAISGLTSKSLFKFDNNGVDDNQADVYFTAKDQYGKTAMSVSYIKVINQVTGGAVYSINSTTGALVVTGDVVKAGDKFTVTVMTSNGMTKTVNFSVVAN